MTKEPTDALIIFINYLGLAIRAGEKISPIANRNKPLYLYIYVLFIIIVFFLETQ